MSSIQEEILQSRTKSINFPQNNLQKTPSNINRPDEKTFLKYYQQNIQLKNQVIHYKQDNRLLRQQLQEKSYQQQKSTLDQLKHLSDCKKNQWCKTSQSKGKRNISGLRPDQHKVQHLLEIIDHYKDKLSTQEEQIINLKRQKHLLQQDVNLKEKRFSEPESNSDHSIKQEFDLKEKLRRNIRQIEIERQKSNFQEVAIRGLQAKLKNAEMRSMQFDHLKIENRSLEEKIVRMTQLPGFNTIVDKAEEQRKVKQLEMKLKLTNEKYYSFKDSSIKQQAQLKLLQNKLIQLTHQSDFLEKENQSLRQQSVSNPILDRLNKKPQLLSKVLFEIENPNQISKQSINRQQYQKCILQKQEIATHLLSCQQKLKDMEQRFRQRQRLSKIEKQDLVNTMGQIQTSKVGGQPSTGKNGVIYDGDVSSFSQNTGNFSENTNAFDLYLGEVNLLESLVHSITGLKSSESPLILATVDFYNHNTEHSKLTQGYHCDLLSQFSFRVTQDEFFFKFIQKGHFQIDLWATEGNKNFHIGKAVVQLKPLAIRAKPRVASVVSTAVPLYMNQKVTGSINLVMRVRLPIYDRLQKISERSVEDLQTNENSIKRKLVIHIQDGQSFSERSNTFVYYSFRLEDYYTKTARGSSPIWSHYKMIDIIYDTDMKNFLRKNELQFTVFDDSVMVNDEKGNDIIGSASISLLPLLEGKQVRERLQVKKGNQRKGNFDVKIFWFEQEVIKPNQEDPRSKVVELHEDLHSFMNQHEIQAEKVFRIIDGNRTGMISYEQFDEWIGKLHGSKYSHDITKAYYKRFKQPLNLNNFVIKLNEKAALIDSPSKEGSKKDIVPQLGMINQFLKKNSIQMKKQTLQQFLKGKKIIDVACEIDTDQDGLISQKELQTYFSENEIQAQVPNEKIKLFDFLKKHQHLGD